MQRVIMHSCQQHSPDREIFTQVWVVSAPVRPMYSAELSCNVVYIQRRNIPIWPHTRQELDCSHFQHISMMIQTLAVVVGLGVIVGQDREQKQLNASEPTFYIRLQHIRNEHNHGLSAFPIGKSPNITFRRDPSLIENDHAIGKDHSPVDNVRSTSSNFSKKVSNSLVRQTRSAQPACSRIECIDTVHRHHQRPETGEKIDVEVWSFQHFFSRTLRATYIDCAQADLGDQWT